MKRLRDGTEVDHNLIKIFEDLASEDETERLQAVLRLETVYTDLIEAKNDDQRVFVLRRLFRGLSSGRKAARLGFAIALTRLLSKSFKDDNITSAELIKLLVKSTKPDSNTSGQDERDHYFGRLFGCEAIIRSEILFFQHDLTDWDQLLDILCKVALQKPWLRQVCGWTLFTSVKTSLKNDEEQRYAVRILEKLTEHKLIRTPEGLAIWMEVKRLHPKARLPQHIWKHDDPLSKDGLRTLANVLKDAKESSKEGSEFEVQGSAMWAANLHFVWDVVLRPILTAEMNVAKHEEYMKQFWHSAVDESLFNPTNSQERKHWGFLVVHKALDIAQNEHVMFTVPLVCSKSVVECLAQSLKSNERYLQRSAQALVKKIEECCVANPHDGEMYIKSLLQAAGMVDFDLMSKTKTIANLIDLCDDDALFRLALGFNNYLEREIPEGSNGTQFKRLVLNHAFKLLVHQVQRAMSKKNMQQEQQVIEVILVNWTEHVSRSSKFTETDKQLVLEKLRLALEQVLKLGQQGRTIIIKLCDMQTGGPYDENIDDEMFEILQSGERRFKKLYRASGLLPRKRKQTPKAFTDPELPKLKNESPAKTEGLTLLYALLLFEIYTGDMEIIPVLQELLDSEEESNEKGNPSQEPAPENADALIEILLSFASRPSKFLRRITLTIFESITSEISHEGLRSLTDILGVKETRLGQQQLFEANGDGEEMVDDEGEELDDEQEEEDSEDQASDVEMLDSDVEVISASESTSSDKEDDDSSNSASDSDSDSESVSTTSEPDAALLALEASLASALGTRKLTLPNQRTTTASTSNSSNASTSDSNSDSDMTDSEMLELDGKLAEFFRARTASTQTSSQKKKDNKSARENVVNFKNRVLDMLDAYVKKEYLNPRVLDLILPLLILARGNTKQLADRAVKVLSWLCKKCQGLGNVPVLATDPSTTPTSAVNDVETNKSKCKSKPKDKHNPHPPSLPSPSFPTPTSAIELLTNIHREASRANTSNVHRSTCSKTSILVVKVLLKAGVGIDRCQAVYDKTERRKTEEPETSSVASGFFEEWRSWRESVKGRVG